MPFPQSSTILADPAVSDTLSATLPILKSTVRSPAAPSGSGHHTITPIWTFRQILHSFPNMPDSDPPPTPADSATDIGVLRRSLTLPTVEPSPSKDNPWRDDLLGRQHLAANLTEFVRPQRDPLVISLHGGWGSGKTFFLRRWVHQLQNEGFPTFYYNAWSDDYSETPLISILTALEGVGTPVRAAARSLRAAAASFLLSAPANLLKAQAGLDLAQLGLDPKSLTARDKLFDAYRTHRSHRDRVRNELLSLSESIYSQSNLPTICVIDELDRCRPTFAIDLLETVKHVLDIPRFVFLFALNRRELTKSIRSVYGEIDADGYLRRFFNVHLDLPSTDTEPYSTHLLQRFNLHAFFSGLSVVAKTSRHREEYKELASVLPRFWKLLGLPLRDIEYCVTTLALVARNLPERHTLFPFLLAPLPILRLRDPNLYQRFISGSANAADVVNRLDTWTAQPGPEKLPFLALDLMEVSLYAAHPPPPHQSDEHPILQLRLLAKSSDLTHPDLISDRTIAGAQDRAAWLLRHYDILSDPLIDLSHGSLAALAPLLNLSGFPPPSA